MTLVVDASVVLASLIDEGPRGLWAVETLREADLVAPHHLMVEAASGLSRLVRNGSLSERTATTAHAGLLSLPFRLLPYRPYGDRVWELRQNVTAYDSWYVAIAETLGAPLATLDRRLANAPGPRCAFLTPEA